MGDFQVARPQTPIFLATYTHIIIHIYTQADATKHITLLRIRAQGNNYPAHTSVVFRHYMGRNMLNENGVQHGSTLLIDCQKMLNVDYSFASN